MKTLHVVGFSGAGKTTLIERLVPLLAQDGWRVAVVKHHHGELSAGKDSSRLFATGVPTQVLAADGILAMASEPTLEKALAAFEPVPDLVLVEGLKSGTGPKIWVGEGLPADMPMVVALVGEARQGGMPHFAPQEAARLYEDIVRPLVTAP